MIVYGVHPHTPPMLIHNGLAALRVHPCSYTIIMFFSLLLLLPDEFIQNFDFFQHYSIIYITTKIQTHLIYIQDKSLKW